MENSRFKLKDYRTYHLSYREMLLYGCMGLGIASLLGYIFYQSVIACVILAFFLPFYLQMQKEELCSKQKQVLNEQFKETVTAVCASLRAGYSVENSFREAYTDIQIMYGEDSLMGKELFYMAKGLDNNVILERLLSNLAVRSGIDSITDFSEIFEIAKRNGGDMSHIMNSCVTTICEKIEVKKEIQTLIHAKKFEQKVMNAVPLFIILYIQSTSPGFFDPLYHNLAGIFIMTICLILYAAAYFMAKKITRIQV